MYVNKGIGTSKLLQWSQASRSSFYYKRSARKKGIGPSTHSANQNGEFFENVYVIKDIEMILRQEFCCYGYRNMTGELKEMG